VALLDERTLDFVVVLKSVRRDSQDGTVATEHGTRQALIQTNPTFSNVTTGSG
jgi:hypothetical protein